MLIKKNTEMFLFRFRNFGKYDFILSHREVLQKNGYVWMLKVGRRSDICKLKKILSAGGWMILRAPKADGAQSYVAHFVEVIEKKPDKDVFPAYYSKILNGEGDIQDFSYNASFQWFKVDRINELPENYSDELVLLKSGKKVNDVIGTTRTAVMFVKNQREIII